MSDKEEAKPIVKDDSNPNFIMETYKTKVSPVNEQQPDLDDVLANQDQSKINEFDESKYQGYDGLVQYYSDNGSVKAQIHIKLSHLDKFRIPYNISGNYVYPQFQLMDVVYFPVTTKAYQERQTLLAEVDDLTRTQQVQQLKLQEMQQALQKRMGDRFRQQENGDASKRSLNDMSVLEIQDEINQLQQIDLNISKKIQDKKSEANWLGFRIYFHIDDKEVFDNCRVDQLDDILKGCDQKQITSRVKSSKNSLSSPMQIRQGVS